MISTHQSSVRVCLLCGVQREGCMAPGWSRGCTCPLTRQGFISVPRKSMMAVPISAAKDDELLLGAGVKLTPCMRQQRRRLWARRQRLPKRAQRALPHFRQRAAEASCSCSMPASTSMPLTKWAGMRCTWTRVRQHGRSRGMNDLQLGAERCEDRASTRAQHSASVARVGRSNEFKALPNANASIRTCKVVNSPSRTVRTEGGKLVCLSASLRSFFSSK